jgi:hypothetical protein
MDVVSVQPKADFSLLLAFADGQSRRFDMRPMLAVRPWNRIASPALLMQARVDQGTLVWPGEIDVARETLYLDSVSVIDASTNR